MLHVHFGNRIERLADALAGMLADAPPADPLAPETIVVGHAGMDEWLKRALAARLGIAANLEFQQPAAFVWRMLRARDPGLPRVSPLDRGPLVWRLYAALGGAQQAPEVRRYLAAGDELSRFELAEALATVFEQYQIYRPETILDWEAGKSAAGDAAWQAALWRRVADAATPNPARLYREFAQHAHELPADSLPARISVFGISALAPVYLALLAAVAGNREAHFYVPDPSRAYWGDIESEKRLARWRLSNPERADYATGGHPLLGAFGTQNRDFIELLHDVPGDSVTCERFERAAGGTLLARLQNDMLELVEEPEHAVPASDDDSILVHVCHSRRREVEVLHDALLAAFESDPMLGPEDILVMAPNMDDYAGHVAAVFGAAPPERHIPWSIAERSLRAEHPLAEALLSLLALPESRLKASEVLGLLDLPAAARGFELGTEDLENLHRWVGEAGIRWGWSGAHRAQFELPAESAFTWRFGLDRLLAGYALAPDNDSLWDGIAPCGALEGKTARALGPLCVFVAQLERWREELRTSRTLADWAAKMREMLAAFAPESSDELAAAEMLRRSVAELEAEAGLAGIGEPVPHAVARAALASRLGVPHHPRPFLSGRVSFCALAPMRSIPAKILWLLGMSEEDFPRRGRAPGFDLIAARLKRGDRARHREDRALFLEALLSARGAFHASYVGRSERDNGPLPASVVVNELLDVAERMGAARESIVIEHPLQPFSANYRAEPRRAASYAAEWLGPRDPEAAPAVFSVPAQAGGFAGNQADEATTDIALDELIQGLSNPARRYLDALGIAHWSRGDADEDDEPFALDGLQAWKVKSALLERRLAMDSDFDAAPWADEFAARGWLPTGEAGRVAFARCCAETQPIVAALRERRKGRQSETREIGLLLDPWRLHGRIAGVYPGAGLIRVRAGKLRAKDRLALWVEHLALAAGGEAATESRLLTEDGEFLLHSVTGAGEKLKRLCAHYAESAREPLPLLPELSFDYQKRLLDDGTTPDGALSSVRSRWQRWEAGDGHVRIPDAEDFALAFRGRENPLDGDFETLANEVFGALANSEAGS